MASSALKNQKARWRRIKTVYGLSKDDYERILQDQGGSCFICKRTVDQIKRSKSRWLTVDHCHVTGKIRGLLCSDCNGRILPAIKENSQTALRILEYLIRDPGYGEVPEKTKLIDKAKLDKRNERKKRIYKNDKSKSTC